MNKQDFSRIAADRSQLEKFKNETIDKINDNIIEYVKAELSTSATFADLYELIGFDPDTAPLQNTFYVDINITMTGLAAKGPLELISIYQGAWVANLKAEVGPNGVATYNWGGYKSTDTVYDFLRLHALNPKVFVDKPVKAASGTVLTATGNGNMAWRAPAAGGTKLYKHTLRFESNALSVILINADSSAITSFNSVADEVKAAISAVLATDTTGTHRILDASMSGSIDLYYIRSATITSKTLSYPSEFVDTVTAL